MLSAEVLPTCLWADCFASGPDRFWECGSPSRGRTRPGSLRSSWDRQLVTDTRYTPSFGRYFGSHQHTGRMIKCPNVCKETLNIHVKVREGVVVVTGGPGALKPCVLMNLAWGPMCRVLR